MPAPSRVTLGITLRECVDIRAASSQSESPRWSMTGAERWPVISCYGHAALPSHQLPGAAAAAHSKANCLCSSDHPCTLHRVRIRTGECTIQAVHTLGALESQTHNQKGRGACAARRALTETRFRSFPSPAPSRSRQTRHVENWVLTLSAPPPVRRAPKRSAPPKPSAGAAGGGAVPNTTRPSRATSVSTPVF
jgi:hypothetical protein